ncbi:hypothetical protein BGW37DRAFT_501203 [Umbelopsis sp. PMI_123]|nr:hypothetical protein BGW37DRAFT_501203 [Umbelopsis sp. PMI_123]
MLGSKKSASGQIALDPYSDTEALLSPSPTDDPYDIETQSIRSSASIDMNEMTGLENSGKGIRMLLSFIAKMVIDIAVPLIIYHNLKHHTSLIVALMVSSIPPLLLVIGMFIYKRKIDIMGCLAVFGFIISAIFALITGDARMVLLRDSSITCIIGICFLLTLIPIRTEHFNNRPVQFIFYAQILEGHPPIIWKDGKGDEYSLSYADWQYTYVPYVRKYSIYSTIAWGLMLEIEFLIKVILITSNLTIDQVVNYGSIIITSMTMLGMIFNAILFIPMRRKRIEALRLWKAEKYHPAPPPFAQRD